MSWGGTWHGALEVIEPPAPGPGPTPIPVPVTPGQPGYIDLAAMAVDRLCEQFRSSPLDE